MYNIFTITKYGSVKSYETFLKILIIGYLLTTFVNRDVSNIFLIILLSFSLLFIIFQKIKLSRKEWIALELVIIFTTLIIVISIIHDSPISEVDNYTRAFLLFPIYLLLRDIRFSRNELIYIFSSCIFFSFLLFLYGGNETFHGERFQGSSSTPLTYGNMLMTLVLLLIVTLKTSINLNFLIRTLIIMLGIFLVYQTGTKGSVVGLIITLPVILLFNKKLIPPVAIIVVLSIIFAYVTPFSKRVISFADALSTINYNNLTHSTDINFSVNERLYYYQFSLGTIKENSMLGIGPHMFKKNLQDDISKKKLNITISDHAHNEFLDIFAKFGILVFLTFLALLLFMMYVFMKYKDSYLGQSGFVIIISQIGYMLTQSQLAHHQSTVFFIFLLFLIASQIKQIKN